MDVKSQSNSPIMKYSRPHFQYDKATPILAWGHGVSPTDPDHSSDLLAISWGKAVMLFSLVNIMGGDFDARSDLTALQGPAETEIEMRQMKQVGFICSEHFITSVRFLGDSLLAIVVNCNDSNEMRVLSTMDFLPE